MDHVEQPAISIARMSRAGIDTAIDWAAREGWNPGVSDADCFSVTDPEGFLVARAGQRPVGTISAVDYGDRFAFVGLFIVEPDMRGRGIGSRLWAAAMERVRGRVAGLDGVVAMQASYARSGFVLAHRNVRFGGRAVRLPRPAGAADAVGVLGPDDLGAIEAYDEPCFGAPRRDFLAAWVAQPGALTVGLRDDRGLLGYGTIRACRDGFKVGPLFAEGGAVAEALLDAMLVHAGPGAMVFLDVPEPNVAAARLAVEHGLSPVFETARMYAGGDPGLPLHRIFGITTFELG